MPTRPTALAMGSRNRRRGSRRFVTLALALLVSALAVYAYTQGAFVSPADPPPPVATGTLTVHYVDVGQGDGTIWELPDGSIAIYDCGPPDGGAAMVAYLRERLARPPGSTIALLIASHGHLDHVGGCGAIFDEYEVERVAEAWYEGADAPQSYLRFLAEVEAEGAEVLRLPALRPGATLPISSARATLLWPSEFAGGGWDSIAEASLVVRLEHGATSFCFQGDIEAAQEAKLDARCDVYLVGHHGSRHASSEAWLGRMQPQLAVVSYGDNSYGHPHSDAVCRVQATGIPVYSTPRGPGVVIASDGATLRVVHGVAEPPFACA